MQLEWYHYLIAILGSALAGSINTLAGNGSAITLTILTEPIGLPGNLANGTNRIGIFTQSAPAQPPSGAMESQPQPQLASHIPQYHRCNYWRDRCCQRE